MSIAESCAPRKDLVKGSFNPEMFTANLMQVINHYRGETDVVENIYTDPAAFFGEGTYPTDGMRQVLRNVFGRLRGRMQLIRLSNGWKRRSAVPRPTP